VNQAKHDPKALKGCNHVHIPLKQEIQSKKPKMAKRKMAKHPAL
jgi:hypothetical protein